jgi:hypothetical protein
VVLKKTGGIISKMDNSILLIFVISGFLLQTNNLFAFDYYATDYLRMSDSPISRGMGACEINLINEYSPVNNPGAVGLFHLEKRFSFSFPEKSRWGNILTGGADLNSYSISAGFPINIREKILGMGFAYSKLNSDLFREDYLYRRTFTYVEKSDYFSIAAAYKSKIRIGLGYTLKKIDSSFRMPWAPDEILERMEANCHDLGIFFDYPLRNSAIFGEFFAKIDKENVKHNIIPSIAYVRSNMSKDYRRKYPIFGGQSFPEISKIGFSVLFISDYKDAEIYSFRIISEFNSTIDGEEANFMKFGIEVGAGGAFYMRAGLWSPSYTEENIWTYGFGLNLGGITRLLYSSGKINTINPVARYILKNIRISADYAVERSDDESIYEDSDYFKISISI